MDISSCVINENNRLNSNNVDTPINIINTIETNNIDFAGPSTNTGTTETSNLIFADVSLVVESHTECLDHSALGKKNFQNIDKTKNVCKKEKLLNLVEICYVIVKCNGELNPGQVCLFILNYLYLANQLVNFITNYFNN